MTGVRWWRITAVPMLLAGGVLGCTILDPRPDNTRFYVLSTALPEDAAQAARPLDVALGLGPIQFPGYLDRGQYVVRLDANRLQPQDVDRWAEGLQRQFARLLAENLVALLGTQRIVAFPWFRSVALDASIELAVTHFEATKQGEAWLQARWTIRDPRDGRALGAGESDVREPIARSVIAEIPGVSPDVEAGVAALSRALGRLSEEIAAGVRRNVVPGAGKPTKPRT